MGLPSPADLAEKVHREGLCSSWVCKMPKGLGGGREAGEGGSENHPEGKDWSAPSPGPTGHCAPLLRTQQAGEVCVHHGGHTSECGGPSWGVGWMGLGGAPKPQRSCPM